MALRYRYLVSDKSQTHEGIPMCDLTDEDVAKLTAEQRAVLEASPLYEAVKAETGKRSVAETAPKEGEE